MICTVSLERCSSSVWYLSDCLHSAKWRLALQGKIIKVEERSIGSVKGSVYWAYIKAWGRVWLPLSLIAAAFFERAVAVGQNYWLKVREYNGAMRILKASQFCLLPYERDSVFSSLVVNRDYASI